MKIARSFRWTITFEKVADFDQGIYPYRADADLKQFSICMIVWGIWFPLFQIVHGLQAQIHM